MAEVLVSGPRVAVGAADLAPPEWIHRPPKRHPGSVGARLEPIHELHGLELLKYRLSPSIHDGPNALDEARRRNTRPVHIVSMC